MTAPINGLGSLVPPPLVDPFAAAGGLGAVGDIGTSLRPGETAAPSGGFGKLLVDALERDVSMQANAETRIGEHLSGGEVSMIDTVTDLKQADLALRLMIQVRNKLLAAYDEIKQIRI